MSSQAQRMHANVTWNVFRLVYHCISLCACSCVCVFVVFPCVQYSNWNWHWSVLWQLHAIVSSWSFGNSIFPRLNVTASKIHCVRGETHTHIHTRTNNKHQNHFKKTPCRAYATAKNTAGLLKILLLPTSSHLTSEESDGTQLHSNLNCRCRHIINYRSIVKMLPHTNMHTHTHEHNDNLPSSEFINIVKVNEMMERERVVKTTRSAWKSNEPKTTKANGEKQQSLRFESIIFRRTRAVSFYLPC